jgi:hypothetical protein
MRYSPTFMKMCKPSFRLGTLILRIGMVLLIVGLFVGLFGKEWMIFLIASCCCLLGIILINIPTYYLAVGFINLYDETVTAKEATKIAQNHLKEPRIDAYNTVYFVQDIIDGFGHK